MSAQRAAAQSGGVALALDLLTERERERALPRDGYVDVLLTGELRQEGVARELMHSGLLSRIYERAWRPALGRVAKGVHGPSMTDELLIAEQLLELSPGDRVLDVACGPGNFARRFADGVSPGGLVVGIDGSRAMLERAVREAEGVEGLAFVMGDAERLPFQDTCFDGICCFAALNLFARPFDALDEMRRVLRPGGRIAIFTSCSPHSAPLRAAAILMTGRTGLRIFEPDELTSALRERGFERIRHRITGLTQFVGGRSS